MIFPKVNPKLLPLKAHFFLLIGGINTLTPFLTTMAKERGYSGSLVGVVFSVMPAVAVLSRPVCGAVTDRYRCRKTVVLYTILVTALVTASYGFLPNVDGGEGVDALLTYQFWLFVVFLVARFVTKGVLITLSETICLQSLGKDSHKFGEQRLWGTFGWGIMTVISGWLIDWYSNGKSTKDYTLGLVLWVVLLLADFIVFYQIHDSQSNEVSKHIFKDVKKVVSDFKLLNFFTSIVFFGIFHASTALYLSWHIDELVSKYHPEKYSSIKTIQGAIIFVRSFGGEAPFFFLSGIIIKKIGHLNSIIIGLATLSIRFFLYYIITNPVWLLPVEVLSGLGFALPYSAMTAYGAVIAPEGLKGTVQGLIGTLNQGIGLGLGSLITGYLFDKIGSSETFLVLGISVLFFCFIQTITTGVVFNKIAKFQTKENVEVANIEHFPNQK